MLTDPRAALGAAVLGGVGAALLFPEGVSAQKEEEIDLKKLPKGILESAKELFPEAVWKHAAKHADGETYYELAGLLPGKKAVIVEIDADGDVFHVETQVDVKEVPKVVMDGFRKKYPKATIDLVFEVEEEDEEDGLEVTGYEFHATRTKRTPGKGKKKAKEEKVEFEAFVTIDGKVEEDEN